MKRQRIENPQPGLTVMLLGIVLTATLFSGGMLHAEVTFDGTLGAPGTLNGPDFQINADRGRQVGSNLFHSFSQFNLSNAESATFNGAPDITNVISRVTGGSVSSINGNLNVAIPKANFFFINPAGVIIGPDASINVEGAFSLSTADYLTLLNGGRFDASAVGKTVLSVGDPKGYGFLGSTVGDITIEAKKIKTNGKDVVLVGGVITLDGKNAGNVVEGAQIETQGGDVRLTSVTGEEPFTVNEYGVSDDNTKPGNAITIKNQFSIDTSGARAGGVSIRGGKLIIENSNIVATTRGYRDGGALNIRVNNVELHESHILSNSTSTGNAGVVHIEANKDVILSGGSTVLVRREAGARTDSAPGIAVKGGEEIRLTDQSSITTGTAGDVDAGDIYLEAQLISILGGSRIVSTTGTGPLAIPASPGVITEVFSLPYEPVQGDGGNIKLIAEKVVLEDEVFFASTSFTKYLEEHGETRFSEQYKLLVNDYGNYFEILTPSQQDAFNKKFNLLSDQWYMDTKDTIQKIRDENIRDPGGLFSASYTEGDAGNIQIEAHEIEITGKAQISSLTAKILPSYDDNFNEIFVQKQGSDGGDINLTADKISIKSSGRHALPITDREFQFIHETEDPVRYQAGLYASADTTTGTAGDITLNGEDIQITNGAVISTESSKSGEGGNISIAGDNTILVDGVDDLNNPLGTLTKITASASGISGSAGSVSFIGKKITISDGAMVTTDIDKVENGILSGDAGAILLDGDNIEITDGAVLVSTTQNYGGHGGAIRINAKNNLDVSGQYHGVYKIPIQRYSDLLSGVLATTILASTQGVSDGGLINLQGSRVAISDGARVSARTTATGNGGSITISGRALTVKTAATLDASSAGSGNAGNIMLSGQRIAISDGAELSTATLGDGQGGSIMINALTVRLSSASINTQSDGASAGGAIRVKADELRVDDGTILRTSNNGDGDAGSITLETTSTIRIEDSKIATEALAGGGGNITLLTNRLLKLENAMLSSSVLGSNGNAGNIFIDPDLVLLKDSTIQANAVNGNGGTILVQAGILIQDANSVIEASSEYGVDGTVVIDAPILQLQRETKRTKKAANTLIRNRCRAKSTGHSSFTVATPVFATYAPQVALITIPSDIYIEEQYVIPDVGQHLAMMICSE